MTSAKWLNTAYLHPDDVPNDKWVKLMMSRQAYEAMVKERSDRDRLAPSVGDPAPDFKIRRLSKEGSVKIAKMVHTAATASLFIPIPFYAYTATAEAAGRLPEVENCTESALAL